MHTFQPFQGYFPNVISPDNKDYFGFSIFLRRKDRLPGRADQEEQNERKENNVSMNVYPVIHGTSLPLPLFRIFSPEPFSE
jgi:hypothetical protein